jgi:hypothetical protein
MMELLQELAKPTRLSDAVRNRTIFSLRTRTGHRRLPLGGPRDQIITKENAETRGGFSGVRTTSPVSVRVCNEIEGGRLVNLETKVGSALYIAQYAFDELKVRVSRIMHEEANLLDGVGEVGTCEGKVLESTSKASVEARVREGGPM